MYSLTTKIYYLSLHDALPIFQQVGWGAVVTPMVRHLQEIERLQPVAAVLANASPAFQLRIPGQHQPLAGDLEDQARSEEHTSELQSPCNLVCRLLLEKKKE